MKKTYLTDPVKMASSGVFGVFLLILLPEFIAQGTIPGTILFGGIGLAFTLLALYYSRLMTIDEEGIKVTYFGLVKVKSVKWSELSEVGICGMRLFKPKTWKSTGALYIYFSEEVMSEDDRFNMVFKWPRPENPYLYYSEKKLREIRKFYPKKIEIYNADKMKLTIQLINRE